jgi:flagellar hook-associated protein 1 FlgK
MRTTFGTFNIATSGLFASQRALDITSHNIANAQTEGYSRQLSLQRATNPMVGDPSGVIGTGVEVYDIIRVRSEYLDHKYWGQNQSYTEWTTKSSNLEVIEGIFNEPSDTGIRKVMDEFFSSIEEMTKDPANNTYRVAVAEKAGTLAATINRNGHEIANAIRDVNFSIVNEVEQVNSLSERIVNLNKQIFSFEVGGQKANDLRDQRSVLVDELSSIINITANEMPGPNGNNYFDVKVSGMTLINHVSYNELGTMEISNELTDAGAGKISKVIWKDTGSQEVRIEGGELKGLISIRDGDGQGSNYRGLPYYLSKLTEFARDFTKGFNAAHALGYDYNGNQGQDFFSVPGDISNVNCITFAVNPDLLQNPNLIAASSLNNGQSNNENLKPLIALRSSTDIFTTTKGTPDDFVKSLLSALAVDSSQAKRMSVNSEALIAQTKNKIYSESGVSLDEEMSNMVKFQQTYSASARLITSLDKILDTMINRLGLVGR